jgi:CheY-like chemotaxis protein
MNTQIATTPLRILIVENHNDTVKWLQLFLEDLGHKVGATRSVAEATKALKANDWDVLISDIGLPDGTGWDLLQNRPNQRPIFAIAMSGFGMNSDMNRSQAAGFRQHLLKPFKTDELEKLLAQAASELALNA